MFLWIARDHNGKCRCYLYTTPKTFTGRFWLHPFAKMNPVIYPKLTKKILLLQSEQLTKWQLLSLKMTTFFHPGPFWANFVTTLISCKIIKNSYSKCNTCKYNFVSMFIFRVTIWSENSLPVPKFVYLPRTIWHFVLVCKLKICFLIPVPYS